ncbi:tripartite tricarboxylate transporter TctB family protein [Streptomyces sp. KM273126]|uniref:tripartite tricarboxylate transporter TctB family protein n=1 Tax=Streptomyces sp. KM273126 TaxID=2545247 RepID=UPI0015EC516D|nr:tripartite tricarboxylate transporter TctB family protein [Streptomyces sp. KM273126]MBA2813643.1 tripartite tricarboxylate transporter TctB family protein [Streptomyces sp. KM273126]
MTTHPAPDTGPAAYLRRRTGLIVPLLLLVTGIVLGAGTLTMEVPANVASPGPQLFPTMVAVACVVFAVLLGIDILRRPEPEQVAAPTDGDPAIDAGTAARTAEAADVTASSASTNASETAAGDTADAGATRVRSNRRAVAGLVGTIVAFIVLLVPLGWLLSGALLFWGVARALGSRRPVFDIFLSIAISSIVQLAFSAGLGLNLPPGVLAGVL